MNWKLQPDSADAWSLGDRQDCLTWRIFSRMFNLRFHYRTLKSDTSGSIHKVDFERKCGALDSVKTDQQVVPDINNPQWSRKLVQCPRRRKCHALVDGKGNYLDEGLSSAKHEIRGKRKYSADVMAQEHQARPCTTGECLFRDRDARIVLGSHRMCYEYTSTGAFSRHRSPTWWLGALQHSPPFLATDGWSCHQMPSC